MEKTIGWDDGMSYILKLKAEKASEDRKMNACRTYSYYGARATTDDIIAFRRFHGSTKTDPLVDLQEVKKVSDLKVKKPAGLEYYLQLALNGVVEKPEKPEVAAQAATT